MTNPYHGSYEATRQLAQAADDDVWVHFYVPTNSTMSQDSKLQKLKKFLEKAKPSKLMRSDGIGWISIRTKPSSSYHPDPEGAIEEWEKYQGSKNLDYVNYLACKYKVLSAKWMPRFSTDRVDHAWKKICMGLLMNSLGSCVHSAKVSFQLIIEYSCEYLQHYWFCYLFSTNVKIARCTTGAKGFYF